jgi:O-antigen ligase
VRPEGTLPRCSTDPLRRGSAAAEAVASKAALGVLTALAVLAPWPLAGAIPEAQRALTLLALGTGTLCLAAMARAGARPSATEKMRLGRPQAALLVLALVAAVQLIPLPSRLHALLSPPSAGIWHPRETAAAAALGSDAKPLSAAPMATLSALAWLLGLATLSSLGSAALSDRRILVRATVVLVAGGVVVAVYGVVARVLFGSLLFGRITVPTVSPFGPFVSKNHFAAYVAPLALLSLGLALGWANRIRRSRGSLSWVGEPGSFRVVMAFGATVVLVLSTLVSQSRGGALSLFAGGLLFFALRWETSRDLRRGLLLPAAGIAVTGALLGLLPEEARSRLMLLGGAGDASSSYRLAIWADALRAARSSPLLGFGVGSFGEAFPPFKTSAGQLRVEHAENDYIELVFEGGALAGLLLVWTALGIRRVKRRLFEGTRATEQGVLCGALAGLGALAAHSVVDFSLRLPACGAVAAVLLGMLGTSSPIAVPFRPGRSLRLLGATMLMMVLLAEATAPPWGPSRRLRALQVAISMPTPTPARILRAEAELMTHLRAWPADAEAWAFLSWLHTLRTQCREAESLARHARELDPLRPGLADFEAAVARSCAGA